MARESVPEGCEIAGKRWVWCCSGGALGAGGVSSLNGEEAMK
jgi:hypothetical protein